MLKRILLTLALLSLVSVTTGCYNQQVVADTNYNAAKSTPDFQGTTIHIIGLVGISNTATLNEVCPSGAGLVETKAFLASPVLSIGQMAVYCK
ncbi:MAG: hypothetical protein VYE40_13125 [Myxococcota bacterium]|jgi:hypothetical protein|nr:hypothetical protein [Myxococcota bacterium]